jgi:hypothetical protein
MLLHLYLQYSPQLETPHASQNSLVKCLLNTEDARPLRLLFKHRQNGLNRCTYSTRLPNLVVIVTDISGCISSPLLDLEVWCDQLPTELLLS